MYNLLLQLYLLIFAISKIAYLYIWSNKNVKETVHNVKNKRKNYGLYKKRQKIASEQNALNNLLF